MVLERTMGAMTRGESSGTRRFEVNLTWPDPEHRVNIQQADRPEMSREVAEAWERLNNWDLRWAQYEAEMRQMREDWSRLQEELSELKGPCRCDRTYKVNKDPVDKSVHLAELDLQGAFDERARLREKKTGVEAEVKQVEEEIKRRLYGKRVVMVEQGELDFVSLIGAHDREDKRKSATGGQVGGEFHRTRQGTRTVETNGRQTEPSSSRQGETKEKRPLKCWICEGPHMAKNCSYRLRGSDENQPGRAETLLQPGMRTETRWEAQEEYIRRLKLKGPDKWADLLDKGEPPDSPPSGLA